jgi:microsomal dipeptidase-like Zn-dependent dipeptidase
MPDAVARAAGAAPTGVTATGTPASATLAWQAVQGAASYVVIRKEAGAPDNSQPVAAPATGMTDGGLTPSTAYSYTVRAIQADGREGSADVTFTTPPAVNPAGFTAVQTGDGQVQLAWKPVSAATYYVVLGPGSINGGVKVTGDTTFVVTGVPIGSQEFKVASYYEPGPISTPGTSFPSATVNVAELLSGWVDLHTHPMINLAFGGKLIHGGVDVGSLLPSDNTCATHVRATSMAQALGDDRPSHGGWNLVNFPCGDNFRQVLIHEFQDANGALVTGSPANGFPNFDQWPKWNDLTHQKMWYEWIRRARDGGLRVMVALATNNTTLGDAVSGPGDGPTDDRTSADLQLAEIKSFVARHNDFMEVALNAADISRIVKSNRIAVVLGMEVDNIGNFNKMRLPMLPEPAQQLLVSNEIQRLYANGVRYVIPVHIMDNVFGGTAIYKNDFNYANLREAGYYWTIECANVQDDITHAYVEGHDVLRAVGAFVKLGLDPLRVSGPPPVCPPAVQPPGQPAKSRGMRNARTLTPLGAFAIKTMMKKGMLIDIDHMGQKTADAVLDIAESFGYPVISGHTGIRGFGEGSDAENSRTPAQLTRISKLHGMFGLGSDGVHSTTFARNYQQAILDMGYMNPAKGPYENGAVGFGTDLNGLVKGPMPGGNLNGHPRVVYGDSIPQSKSGTKSWDYNTEGVAHYGMMWDFVRDLRNAPSNGYRDANGAATGVAGPDLVDKHLFRSANYFWGMWQRVEAKKGGVQ